MNKMREKRSQRMKSEERKRKSESKKKIIREKLLRYSERSRERKKS